MRRRNPSVHQFERILTDTLRALPRILQPLDADLHPSVIRLFSLSYLPQVIHCFLRHEDIGDWIMHAETYLAILYAMKELPACGLRPIFSERLTCDRKWGHEVPLGKGLGTGDNQWFCLKDAVTHLEVHYKRFTALSSRITFPSTLFKLHQLIDGILFLLMQQITD
ncbi:hypothetical protein AMATHDRAFT_156634 [Amanita thiersii Skay4041]|uniref:Uncharacterized protein n=1 Tax=Amanita thiersii Skay4041 TaxID=703135 RepID=A0A2A9NCR8_9AGAR|nr:hypothetical protein AMATHDRAFT_156634 [Amanita thiersii Skay4041]